MTVSAIAQAFIDSDAVSYKDNGRAPRTLTDYGYARKIGAVNHIPVCATLAQLDNYYNGGSAVGSTEFGIDRAVWGDLPYQGKLIPIAAVSQYMPIRRNSAYPNGVSPWAQGVIARNSNCSIPPTPSIATMASGVPNGAFHSIENVDAGSTTVTDAQFNSNVLLRAYLAGLDEYPITPATQLWHSEIDQLNRCSDPGWSGALENEMQAAANALLVNDTSKLRAVRTTVPTPPVTTPPPVAPNIDVAAILVRLQQMDALSADIKRLINGG